jgi:hypothetical protein
MPHQRQIYCIIWKCLQLAHTDEDDIKEADTLAKAQAESPDALTGTRFEFSTEQLKRDRQKALDGPLSTGIMSMAAKTTTRSRLKLKEAQDESAELWLALSRHAILTHRLILFNTLNHLPK